MGQVASGQGSRRAAEGDPSAAAAGRDDAAGPFRRGLLASGAAALAGAALTAPFLGRLEAQGTADVLVIGAGMAGIAAARRLEAQGARVTVLEARDRVGGRLQTSAAWPDLPADLGASWIHGVRGNPLTRLARDLGIETRATSAERAALMSDGRDLGYDLPELAAAARALREARRWAEGQERDPTLAEALAARAPRDPEVRRALDFLVAAEITPEYGAGAEELSAWWFDEAGEFPGGDAILPGGYAALAAALAEGLDLRLGHAVVRLEHTAREVRAVTARGDFRARAAVVTLPLGVLKAGTVGLQPALPPRQARAVARLGTGLLHKAWLRLDPLPGPASADWLEQIPAEPGRWTSFFSLGRVLGQRVAVGLHGGAEARRLEALSPRQVAAEAEAALSRMAGRPVRVTAIQTSRWWDDPFARGAYSFYAPGSRPADREALSEPVSAALVLAGEHTHPEHPATVHGAWLSGERAAAQIGR